MYLYFHPDMGWVDLYLLLSFVYVQRTAPSLSRCSGVLYGYLNAGTEPWKSLGWRGHVWCGREFPEMCAQISSRK